jgi:nitrogen regulatory protein P-II 1
MPAHGAGRTHGPRGIETRPKRSAAILPLGVGAMKRVQAIIREECLDAVVERLVTIGVRGLTIVPVKGAGKSGGRRDVFCGGVFWVWFVPKVELEWFGPDDEADAVVRAIVSRAATGKVGDGRVFVQSVDDALRIRTGERGLDAV